MNSITIRFKDGVPVSNAKDPKTRREQLAPRGNPRSEARRDWRREAP